MDMAADMKRGEFYDLSESGKATPKNLRKPA
jgi:hypothetical protein